MQAVTSRIESPVTRADLVGFSTLLVLLLAIPAAADDWPQWRGPNRSADNPNNPDPSVDVKWGDRTNDEMNLGFFYWAYSDPKESEGKDGGRANPFVGGRSSFGGN